MHLQQKAEHSRRLNLAQLKLCFFSLTDFFSFTIRQKAFSLLTAFLSDKEFHFNRNLTSPRLTRSTKTAHNVGKEEKIKNFKSQFNRWCLCLAANFFHDRFQWATLQDWGKHVVVHLTYFSFSQQKRKELEPAGFVCAPHNKRREFVSRSGTERATALTARICEAFFSRSLKSFVTAWSAIVILRARNDDVRGLVKVFLFSCHVQGYETEL